MIQEKIFPKILIVLFTIIICTNFSYAYNINLPQSSLGWVSFNTGSLLSQHVIKNNGELDSKIIFDLGIQYANYTKGYPNITFYFDPYEQDYNLPTNSFFILICTDNFSSNSYDIDKTECGENSTNIQFVQENLSGLRPYFSDNSNGHFQNYTDYSITFSPNSPSSRVIINIRYSTPSFVYKQGDYETISINFPEMQNIQNQMNYLVLPTSGDVPIFLPDATKTEIVAVKENGLFSNRWAYRFDTSGTKSVWYADVKQIRDNNIRDNILYIIAGFLLGLIPSMIAYSFKNRKIIKKYFQKLIKKF